MALKEKNVIITNIEKGRILLNISIKWSDEMKLINSSKDFENYVKNAWPYGIAKDRELNYIRKYYDKFNKGKMAEVDDQSWEDLSMDEVYRLVDRTYSSAGESILYNMLRTPLTDEKALKKRWKLIKSLEQDEENRVKIQGQFFDLSKDRRSQVVDFISNDIEIDEGKRRFYIFLGRILPIIFLLLSFYNVAFIFAFVFNIIINGTISGRERGKLIENKPMEAIAYIGTMLKISKNLLKLDCEILVDYKEDLENSIKVLNKGKRSFKTVSRNNGINALNFLNLIKDAWSEAFGQTTFDLEIAYYGVAKHYKEYREPVKVLYESLGEIDALISMASYLETVEDEISNPKFIKETKFSIKEGIHPLLKNPVANTINIDKKGIVITGTNMSGKSTFLRMLGINIVFAQSFYFTLSKGYEASFFNLVSSISPEDDVTAGKSYYLAEAEAVLRIINSLDKGLPVFCLIDEIFRGTNPVERIAASEEILRYIQRRDSISLVATHDRELTDLLSESHDFYHFNEKVSDKSGLSFDYKLKNGVLKTGNAIRLLRYLGYPEEIILAAEKTVERNN